MNVWQLVTNASNLPIQAGVNLWNHLNNLGSGAVGGLIPIQYSKITIDDEVVKLNVSDYTTIINVIEDEVISINILEDVIVVSFEE